MYIQKNRVPLEHDTELYKLLEEPFTVETDGAYSIGEPKVVGDTWLLVFRASNNWLVRIWVPSCFLPEKDHFRLFMARVRMGNQEGRRLLLEALRPHIDHFNTFLFRGQQVAAVGAYTELKSLATDLARHKYYSYSRLAYTMCIVWGPDPDMSAFDPASRILTVFNDEWQARVTEEVRDAVLYTDRHMALKFVLDAFRATGKPFDYNAAIISDLSTELWIKPEVPYEDPFGGFGGQNAFSQRYYEATSFQPGRATKIFKAQLSAVQMAIQSDPRLLFEGNPLLFDQAASVAGMKYSDNYDGFRKVLVKYFRRVFGIEAPDRGQEWNLFFQKSKEQVSQVLEDKA